MSFPEGRSKKRVRFSPSQPTFSSSAQALGREATALPHAPTPPQRVRPVDILRKLPGTHPVSLAPSSQARAVDILQMLPSTSSSSSNPSSQAARPVRAIDLLGRLPSAPESGPKTSRPIIKLPRRAQVKVVEDAPMEVDQPTLPSHAQDVIDLTDSDADTEMEETPGKPGQGSGRDSPTERPPFIYHTNNLLATRQTTHSWHGSHRAEDWVLSREELHAEEVDRCRELAVTMDEPGFPVFALSPADLASFHHYFVARHRLENYDDYMHLLALYRNTRAIEAANARSRYSELLDVSRSIETARLEVYRRLRERRGLSP